MCIRDSPTTVRIRREAERGGTTAYILCFKSKGGLVREEIELPIDETLDVYKRQHMGRIRSKPFQ